MQRDFRGAVQIDEVAKLLGEMVAIESINPAYPGATSGEDRLGQYVLQYMRDLGLECVTQEVVEGRHNVLGVLKGPDERGLCFETHLDTMPITNMRGNPLNPVIREGRLYGRGSCDAKGSLAAMLTALRLLVEWGIRPSTSVYLAAVVDEEYKYRGVTHLLGTKFTASAAIVGEPTGLAVVTACKGVVRWKIHCRGKAGHSARPEEGHNAIYDMAELIQAIKEELIPAYRQRVHPLLGTPTINVGCITGGTVVNIIPDSCMIEIDRRMLPGETWDSVSQEFQVLFKKLSAHLPQFNVWVEDPYLIDEAMETDPSQRVVTVARDACVKIMGSSRVQGVSFGCDATKFHRAGIPSLILGPGDILQAHAAEEYVALEEVARAAEIYAQMCVDF